MTSSSGANRSTKRIEIWTPRYSTGEVLVKTSNIEDSDPMEAEYVVWFSKCNLKEKTFTKRELTSFPLERVKSVGVCYVIPDSLFEKEKQVSKNQTVLRGFGE